MDEPLCRICLETEGLFISPCLCNGTMKHVHETCLNYWRFSKPNTLSFIQCDQCRYRYRFYSNTNPTKLITHTLLLYICLCIICGNVLCVFILTDGYTIYDEILMGFVFIGFWGFCSIHLIIIYSMIIVSLDEYTAYTITQNMLLFYTTLLIGTYHVCKYIYTILSYKQNYRIQNI